MLIFQTWGEAFTYSLASIWASFIAFVPAFVLAVLFFVVGWFLGSQIGKAVDHIIATLKIDKMLQHLGVDTITDRAGFRLDTGAFFGALVKWFTITIFLVASLNVMGLTVVTDFLKNDVLTYLPHVIIAAIVLIAATVIADFMGKVVTASSKAGGFKSANFLGTLSRYAIWIFAFIMALTELGIADQLIQTLFTGLVVMFAIAGCLSFGLGGKDAAARFIEHLREHTKQM